MSADNIGILPALAVRFSRAMPKASLRIVTLDHAIASDGLASGDIDVSLALPPTMPRDIRSEAAYAERLVCAMWRQAAPPWGRLTLKQFVAARHVEVALQGKYAIDYVDGALAPLGHRRSIALSVPQFALAAACVVGTTYITMLPASMSKGLAASLPIAVFRPPLELPVITILQLWHARSDADPGSSLLRRVVRENRVGGVTVVVVEFPLASRRGEVRRSLVTPAPSIQFLTLPVLTFSRLNTLTVLMAIRSSQDSVLNPV